MTTYSAKKPGPKGDDLFILALIAIVIALLFMSACSPEKQLSRLLKKHPELAKTTIVKEVHHDTLITKELHKDSIIHNIYSKDTIFIHENKLTVKYLYKGGDSAYLGGKVLPDTLVKVDTLRIPQTTVVKEVKAPKDGWDWLQFWLTIAVLVFVVGKYGGPLILKLLAKIPGWPI